MFRDGDYTDELIVYGDDGIPAFASVFERVAGYNGIIKTRGVTRWKSGKIDFRDRFLKDFGCLRAFHSNAISGKGSAIEYLPNCEH